jgi:hypothetical protein
MREGAVQHLPFNAVNLGFIPKGEVKEGRNHATVFFLRRINGWLVYHGNRPVILDLFHGGPNLAIKFNNRSRHLLFPVDKAQAGGGSNPEPAKEFCGEPQGEFRPDETVL